MQNVSEMSVPEVTDTDVVYHLRDTNSDLVQAWKSSFSDYRNNFKISCGDIFEGAPAVDAVVSPANSFGFMTGGIDYVFTRHFGKQMQKRLQDVVRTKYHGEVLVGQAIIIPAYGENGRDKTTDWSKYNEGKAIKYLISAPTLRVPIDVSKTPNAFLAFKAIILAVRKHNTTPGNAPIRTVLVPGLGTAVGKMPKRRCAWQMVQSYETFVLGVHPSRISPPGLGDVWNDHEKMCQIGEDKSEFGKVRDTINPLH